MRFNGICIVTDNVPELCAFYRKILKLEPEEGNVFEIIPTEGRSPVDLLCGRHGEDGSWKPERSWEPAGIRSSSRLRTSTGNTSD